MLLRRLNAPTRTQNTEADQLRAFQTETYKQKQFY